MKKIEHYMLPQNTNSLYKNEAISSIGLTRDIASKINELIDAYNELSKIDLEWKQTQEGTIRKGILYLKDNLFNTILEILSTAHFYNLLNEDTQAVIMAKSEELQKQINALASGAPIPVTSISGMRDTSKIYVNTTDGKWYYYDGSQWQAVATYQATQINDKEITASKRTAVGDYGYLFSEKGDIVVDVDNLELLINGNYMLIYRNNIITLEQTKVEIPSNEPYMLYFNTDERKLKWHRPSSDIHKANEHCVYLGYISVSDGGYTQINTPKYTVVKNGKKSSYVNGTKERSERIADLLSGEVSIDTTEKTVTFNKSTYSLGVNYITLNNTVNYEEVSSARIKYVVYDTKTAEIKVYENRNSENIDEILLFAFYNKKIYHSYINRHFYKIDGKAEIDQMYPLSSKSAVFFGDSITRGAGGSRPYTTYLGLSTVLNYAKDGALITKQTDNNNSIYDMISTVGSSTFSNDIIGVMGGTNDYWNNVEIGTISDTEINTFYGALNNIAEHLLTNAPDKFIFFMTPITGYRSDARINEGFASFPYPTNNKNFTLDDYCDAIRKVGEKYSIPVLDMKKVSGMCSLIPNVDNKLYHDGIHPNDEGYKQMGNVVKNYLTSNYR